MSEAAPLCLRNSFVSLSADEVMKDHQAGNIAVHSNMPKFFLLLQLSRLLRRSLLAQH